MGQSLWKGNSRAHTQTHTLYHWNVSNGICSIPLIAREIKVTGRNQFSHNRLAKIKNSDHCQSGRMICQELWVGTIFVLDVETADTRGSRVLYWCNQINSQSKWQGQSLAPNPTGSCEWGETFSPELHVSLHRQRMEETTSSICVRERGSYALLYGKEGEQPLLLGEGMGRILDSHVNLLECKNLFPRATWDMSKVWACSLLKCKYPER